jgi:hypothetical protein
MFDLKIKNASIKRNCGANPYPQKKTQGQQKTKGKVKDKQGKTCGLERRVNMDRSEKVWRKLLAFLAQGVWNMVIIPNYGISGKRVGIFPGV